MIYVLFIFLPNNVVYLAEARGGVVARPALGVVGVKVVPIM